jgi:hypothetical protein
MLALAPWVLADGIQRQASTAVINTAAQRIGLKNFLRTVTSEGWLLWDSIRLTSRSYPEMTKTHILRFNNARYPDNALFQQAAVLRPGGDESGGAPRGLSAESGNESTRAGSRQ